MKKQVTTTYNLTQADIETALVKFMRDKVSSLGDHALGSNIEVKLDAVQNRDGYLSDFSAKVIVDGNPQDI